MSTNTIMDSRNIKIAAKGWFFRLKTRREAAKKYRGKIAAKRRFFKPYHIEKEKTLLQVWGNMEKYENISDFKSEY